jgi:diguanylate cyclase (GGDEF)-like protein
MDRVLVKVGRKIDRNLIEQGLEKICQIVPHEEGGPLAGADFDLAIIDGHALKKLSQEIRAKREKEDPLLLPFLLVRTPRANSFPRQLGKLVDDVIMRPLNQEELLARVANLLRLRHYSQNLKKEHDRVVRLSVTDDVSGFHNTRYLHRYLDRLLETPSAKAEDVSLVFFDLDNFKLVVDAHGHLCGAKTLREVAQTVNAVLDEDDRLVRYGGDEFIVILPRQSKAQALAKVERMKEAIAKTIFLQKEEINARLSASFGLATFPEDAQDKRELLAEADRCLFQSKTDGKDRITLPSLPQVQITPEPPVFTEEAA